MNKYFHLLLLIGSLSVFGKVSLELFINSKIPIIKVEIISIFSSCLWTLLWLKGKMMMALILSSLWNKAMETKEIKLLKTTLQDPLKKVDQTKVDQMKVDPLKKAEKIGFSSIHATGNTDLCARQFV